MNFIYSRPPKTGVYACYNSWNEKYFAHFDAALNMWGRAYNSDDPITMFKSSIDLSGKWQDRKWDYVL